MRVWVDCTAAAHPLVLRPIIERLEAQGHEVFITAREYGQTLGILDRLGHAVHARRRARRRLAARQGAGARRPLGAARPSWSGQQPAAAGDRPRLGRPRGRLLRSSGSPRCRCRTTSSPACSARSPSGWRAGCWCRTRSRSSGCARIGAKEAKLVRYPGLKEEYYLADFEPDPAVLGELGLDREKVLVVVRPPPETSEYHAPNDLYGGDDPPPRRPTPRRRR